MKHFARIVLACFALTAGILHSQEPVRGPDDLARTRVPGVVILAIPGKPFSGVDHIEWTRTSADGTTVTTHLEASLARDSEGRIYRESHTFVPGDSQEQSPLNYVHISDPTTRTQITCYLRTYVCNLSDYVPVTDLDPSATGSIDNGARYRTRELLGADQIEGMDVVKSKEVTTTRAGALGNDRDLVETREFWYSEALQTNLKVVRTDPLSGTQLVYVSGISLSEPNPELFKVPIGYTVQDKRPRRNGQASGNP